MATIQSIVHVSGAETIRAEYADYGDPMLVLRFGEAAGTYNHIAVFGSIARPEVAEAINRALAALAPAPAPLADDRRAA